MQEGRRYQKTKEFKERYAKRAGIEGTISQAVYALGMRRCRYRGLAKTHLQHVLTAGAIMEYVKYGTSWVMAILNPST